jgi:hypothetical protein
VPARAPGNPAFKMRLRDQMKKSTEFSLFDHSQSECGRILAARLSEIVRKDGGYINVNETVDASILERWRADPRYRPVNLVE